MKKPNQGVLAALLQSLSDPEASYDVHTGALSGASVRDLSRCPGKPVLSLITYEKAESGDNSDVHAVDAHDRGYSKAKEEHRQVLANTILWQ